MIVAADYKLTLDDLRKVHLVRGTEIVGLYNIKDREFQVAILEKLLGILNYKEFRDSPLAYVSRFKTMFKSYPESSIYRHLIFALDRIMGSNRLKFTNAMVYDNDLRSCNKDIDEDTRKCLLAIVNGGDLKGFKKKVIRKASTCYAAWQSDMGGAYNI